MNKILTFCCSCLLTMTSLSASAQDTPQKPDDYPTRPINFVVPYPPGGGMDITARTLAQQMERVTGYQFRVENRGGGGSVIGNTYVAKQARDDGYTVGILSNPTLAINILNQGAQFEKSDLEPIAGISFSPVVWLTRSDSKLGDKDFKSILAEAKANPNQLKVGVIPNGAFDMATRIVSEQSGAKFNIVPFQGGKPSIVALLGDNIDISSNYYSEVSQYIDSGDLKALAISDNTTDPQLPDAPTMQDLGIDMASGTWGADRFAAVPAGVSEDRKAYLAYLIAETLKDDQTRQAFSKMGVEITPLSSEEESKRYDEAYAAVQKYMASKDKD